MPKQGHWLDYISQSSPVQGAYMSETIQAIDMMVTIGRVPRFIKKIGQKRKPIYETDKFSRENGRTAIDLRSRKDEATSTSARTGNYIRVYGVSKPIEYFLRFDW